MQSAHDQEIEGSIPAFAFIKESAVQKFAVVSELGKRIQEMELKIVIVLTFAMQPRQALQCYF